MTPIYYKVTNTDGEPAHGGGGAWDLPVRNEDGTWTPGAWREVEGDLVACRRGLHLARREHLLSWLGPAIWVAEADGEVIDAGDKVVARRVRLVAGTGWNERTARHFAADCAEDVLHLADPAWRETLEVVLYVVRCYADGGATDEELDAARDAARAAARAAAGGDAAWAAARGDAARAAARAAAWAAAGAAARAAARARQTDRLMEYLA